jgi:hypothetical protein
VLATARACIVLSTVSSFGQLVQSEHLVWFDTVWCGLLTSRKIKLASEII